MGGDGCGWRAPGWRCCGCWRGLGLFVTTGGGRAAHAGSSVAAGAMVTSGSFIRLAGSRRPARCVE